MQKISKFIKKLIYGLSSYSKSTQMFIDQFGDETIVSITIGRHPLHHAIIKSLQILSKVPYDKLFHLFLIIETTTKLIKIEKTYQIDVFANPYNTSIHRIANIELLKIKTFNELTINELLSNTQKFMGDKYFKYSASSSNCQDFIESIFLSNNINEGLEFIKQDTESIFLDKPNLRKFTNTITDIGGKVNIIRQNGNSWLC